MLGPICRVPSLSIASGPFAPPGAVEDSKLAIAQPGAKDEVGDPVIERSLDSARRLLRIGSRRDSPATGFEPVTYDYESLWLSVLKCSFLILSDCAFTLSSLINKGMGGERDQNIREHSATGLNQISRRKVVGKTLAYPKTDSRFWLPRLFRWAGSPNYSMRVQFRGRELSFSLRTGNKESAAKRAATIFGDLVHLGIESTIVKHRGPAVKAPERDVTIGDWISAASKVFDGKPATFGGYDAAALHRVGDLGCVQKQETLRTH